MAEPLANWWELHLRKARGESLNEEEQLRYDAELARQEREATPLQTDLLSLKALRTEVFALQSTNEQLHSRLAELKKEIHSIEQSLSQQIRQALGVGE